MRQWLVGGGLILGDDGLLLVRNRRRNGSHDWSPPGGVIDEGETLLDGLTREVAEETGLVVTAGRARSTRSRSRRPGLGWRLRVEAHLAVDYEGDCASTTPTASSSTPRFVDPGACAGHLDGGHPWVREPLAAWLAERWDGAAARASATASTATTRPARSSPGGDGRRPGR